jgi:oligopeptide transport system ATP-binding protein
MITHDLGVVAGLCDQVLVMYAGRIAEFGGIDDIFYRPQHPYTLGLLASSPRLDEANHEALKTIPGQPPNLQKLPAGCAFAPRCEFVLERCRSELPALRETGPGALKSCHLESAPSTVATAV